MPRVQSISKYKLTPPGARQRLASVKNTRHEVNRYNGQSVFHEFLALTRLSLVLPLFLQSHTNIGKPTLQRENIDFVNLLFSMLQFSMSFRFAISHLAAIHDVISAIVVYVSLLVWFWLWFWLWFFNIFTLVALLYHYCIVRSENAWAYDLRKVGLFLSPKLLLYNDVVDLHNLAILVPDLVFYFVEP